MILRKTLMPHVSGKSPQNPHAPRFGEEPAKPGRCGSEEKSDEVFGAKAPGKNGWSDRD